MFFHEIDIIRNKRTKICTVIAACEREQFKVNRLRLSRHQPPHSIGSKIGNTLINYLHDGITIDGLDNTLMETGLFTTTELKIVEYQQ